MNIDETKTSNFTDMGEERLINENESKDMIEVLPKALITIVKQDSGTDLSASVPSNSGQLPTEADVVQEMMIELLHDYDPETQRKYTVAHERRIVKDTPFTEYKNLDEGDSDDTVKYAGDNLIQKLAVKKSHRVRSRKVATKHKARDYNAIKRTLQLHPNIPLAENYAAYADKSKPEIYKLLVDYAEQAIQATTDCKQMHTDFVSKNRECAKLTADLQKIQSDADAHCATVDQARATLVIVANQAREVANQTREELATTREHLRSTEANRLIIQNQASAYKEMISKSNQLLESKNEEIMRLTAQIDRLHEHHETVCEKIEEAAYKRGHQHAMDVVEEGRQQAASSPSNDGSGEVFQQMQELRSQMQNLMNTLEQRQMDEKSTSSASLNVQEVPPTTSSSSTTVPTASMSVTPTVPAPVSNTYIDSSLTHMDIISQIDKKSVKTLRDHVTSMRELDRSVNIIPYFGTKVCEQMPYRLHTISNPQTQQLMYTFEESDSWRQWDLDKLLTSLELLVSPPPYKSLGLSIIEDAKLTIKIGDNNDLVVPNLASDFTRLATQRGYKQHLDIPPDMQFPLIDVIMEKLRNLGRAPWTALASTMEHGWKMSLVTKPTTISQMLHTLTEKYMEAQLIRKENEFLYPTLVDQGNNKSQQSKGHNQKQSSSSSSDKPADKIRSKSYQKAMKLCYKCGWFNNHDSADCIFEKAKHPNINKDSNLSFVDSPIGKEYIAKHRGKGLKRNKALDWDEETKTNPQSHYVPPKSLYDPHKSAPKTKEGDTEFAPTSKKHKKADDGSKNKDEDESSSKKKQKRYASLTDNIIMHTCTYPVLVPMTIIIPTSPDNINVNVLLDTGAKST